MASPFLDGLLTEYAGRLSTGIGIISALFFAAWKGRLRLRRDSRDDHAEERLAKGQDKVDQVYTEIIDRLSARVLALEIELVKEREKRVAAEDVVASQGRRISTLEAQLKIAGFDGTASFDRE